MAAAALTWLKLLIAAHDLMYKTSVFRDGSAILFVRRRRSEFRVLSCRLLHGATFLTLAANYSLNG